MSARVLAVALAVSLLCSAGGIAWLKWQNDALSDANTRQAQEIGALAVANANQKTVIEALQKYADQAAETLVKADIEKDALRAQARYHERRAQEALKNVTTVDVNDPWPAAVRLSLCLRWLATENRLPAHYDANSAADFNNTQTDPVARFCAAWDGVTPAETVNWTGALLDHIGELHIDRRALDALNGEKKD